MKEDQKFSQLKQRILKAGGELAELAGDAWREELEDAQRDLRDNRFEVAVIGQIKAGKSTFLNALTERPGLLPTDVNPWTAVIARLHFGDPERTQGANFAFFTEQEWKELTEAGGRTARTRDRLKKLADKFVGAAESGEAEDDELARQGREVVERARRRLGAELHALLGSRHELQEVTRSDLDQYLASGEHAEDPEVGKYSDITRESELYFPRERRIAKPSKSHTSGPCYPRTIRVLDFFG